MRRRRAKKIELQKQQVVVERGSDVVQLSSASAVLSRCLFAVNRIDDFFVVELFEALVPFLFQALDIVVGTVRIARNSMIPDDMLRQVEFHEVLGFRHEPNSSKRV